MNRTRVLAAVRRPESAAVAGLVFAAILGWVLVLLHGVAPQQPADAVNWALDEYRRSTLNLALTLMPFAGIAFLWFIAVIRAHLGSRDDRFFETVFLGSGLLFVATMFVAAAALKAALLLDSPGAPLPQEMVAYAWSFANAVLAVFGAKMAAVFTFAAATAGLRAANLPRWIAVLGYLTGLSLLFIPPLPNLAQFLFPGWVALVSILVLVRRRERA